MSFRCNKRSSGNGGLALRSRLNCGVRRSGVRLENLWCKLWCRVPECVGCKTVSMGRELNVGKTYESDNPQEKEKQGRSLGTYGGCFAASFHYCLLLVKM